MRLTEHEGLGRAHRRIPGGSVSEVLAMTKRPQTESRSAGSDRHIRSTTPICVVDRGSHPCRQAHLSRLAVGTDERTVLHLVRAGLVIAAVATSCLLSGYFGVGGAVLAGRWGLETACLPEDHFQPDELGDISDVGPGAKRITPVITFAYTCEFSDSSTGREFGVRRSTSLWVYQVVWLAGASAAATAAVWLGRRALATTPSRQPTQSTHR